MNAVFKKFATFALAGLLVALLGPEQLSFEDAVSVIGGLLGGAVLPELFKREG